MKLNKWIIGAIVGMALLQSGGALADSDKFVVKVENKDDFMAVAAAVRQQMAPGGRWEYANNMEKEQVNRDLNDMQSLFDKYGSTDKMDSNTKMQLVNDQEAVNEILTKRDDNHIVCTNEVPLGRSEERRVGKECRSRRSSDSK